MFSARNEEVMALRVCYVYTDRRDLGETERA